ncbi:MAG: hypothetical protein LBK24_02120 [Puniceicoccales bacterium]|jgi:hypothetical protein|nr:hypothetical protein [Puniceicoccales bacterium]
MSGKTLMINTAVVITATTAIAMIVPTFLFKIDGTGELLEILGTGSVIVKFTLWGCHGNLQEKFSKIFSKDRAAANFAAVGTRIAGISLPLARAAKGADWFWKFFARAFARWKMYTAHCRHLLLNANLKIRPIFSTSSIND